MLRSITAAFGFTALALPALALVGGAPPASGEAARHVVLIVGSHDTSCTATVIARHLLLTAAHCAIPGATYKLVEFDTAHHPTLKDIVHVVHHPQFDLNSLPAHFSLNIKPP